MLINEQTRDFIRQHEQDDVRRLALQGVRDAEVDLAQALQQIAGRQTARRKLPSWAGEDRVVYPPHLNMEQCSSEQTARYKAQIVNGLSVQGRYVDLTGGFGVDFYWMSQVFKERVYVEQNPDLCALAEHNFEVLGLRSTVRCCDTTAYLAEMESADVVYLDPARRDEHGGRTYGIADCSPNVLELLPQLWEKTDHVVLKLSPMLDWRKAVDDLKQVSQVHIVSVDNECKELVLVLDKQFPDHLRLCCVNNQQVFAIDGPLPTAPTASVSAVPANPTFLYEPNASIMKAGCFDVLMQRYPVRQLAPNSHLFISDVEIRDFPGRGFHISAISSMNKRELKATLAAISSANITVRNFPLSVQQLRQKLKLKDGGDTYIFASTAADGGHQLFICRKIG
ncbi:hypothetical protein SAMN04487851_106122 [Prevotella sp. tc2-28]|uniref:class I SAM-dependent methyltransferase n=1 Tax=Prevotella sp. tc2-28 TaxID=1761888 RepID=UPI000899CC9C|nr:class I SAM-dependent methyltransferase [Prevotella sp. tc2-28]SEA45515.1 hypothetical protein SAMN04487851_106122 [Prevotella sp. tc2-28]